MEIRRLSATGPDIIQKTMDTVLEAQENLGRKQQEVAKHQKYARYSDMEENTGIILDLQNQLQQQETTLHLNKVISVEDNQVAARLSLISKLYDNFVALFNARDVQELGTLQNNAENILKNIVSAINDPINGRRLFGGSADNVDSVDINLLPNPNVYRLDDTDITDNPSYYKGDFHYIKDENGLDRTQAAGDKLFQNIFKTLNLFVHLDSSSPQFQNQVNEIERLKLLTQQDTINLQKKHAYITGRHGIEGEFVKDQYQNDLLLFTKLNQDPLPKTLSEMLSLNNKLQSSIGMAKKFMENKELLVNHLILK